MTGLFRDTEGYKQRLARLNKALENYYTCTVDPDDYSNLEELMLACYNLSSHIVEQSTIVGPYNKRHYTINIGNAITDLADVLSNKKGRYALPYEVQKLESASRSIYEYIKKKRGIGKVVVKPTSFRRTM